MVTLSTLMEIIIVVLFMIHVKGKVHNFYQNKTFPLLWQHYLINASKVETNDSCLWHGRFNHLYVNATKLLKKKIIVRDLSHIQDCKGAYEPCQLGKQHRQYF